VTAAQLHVDPAVLSPEAALLGCVLQMPAADAAQALDGLSETDLAEPRHRHVLVAMQRVIATGGRPDPVVLAAELRRTGAAKLFRDRSAELVLLDLMQAAPIVNSAGHYRRLVDDASLRRLVDELGTRLKQTVERPDIERHDLLEIVEQTRARLASSSTAGRGPLAGIPLEALNHPPGDLDWLVEGRMTRATYTVLGAKPGVGKSWLAYDLAIALTSGRPWLGHAVPRPARVLYLDAENGPDLATRRLRQLGARPEDLDGRLLVSTEPLLLSTGEGLARLRATIEQHQPELLIIDTLASHAPSAESDTESMASFLIAVWTLAREHGCALLLLHHLRKGLQGSGKDDPLDSFRGAGHLIGAADRAWILDPLAPGQPRFILRDVKPRQFPCAPPTRITVLDDEDSPIDDRFTVLCVDGVEAIVENGYDAFMAAALTFIDAHNGQPASTKDLVHVGSTLPGEPSERSCKDWLARAAAAGVLHKPKRGHWVRAQAALDDTTPDAEED
jgi:Mrp family chromosome partitioning ATPase